MKNKENNLMYSFRPDWWDIGNNYGPRAYMTILAIRALREFNYFQSELKVEPNEIKKYQSIADTLHANLIAKLWNDDLKYLTSFYEDGNEDTHIYMGSMLASH
jgi:GH15 family glucan-1,4-alpha-glucosidase